MIVAAAISVVISADVAAAELAAVVTVTAVTTVALVAAVVDAELTAIVEAYSIIACGCPSYVKISTSLDSSKSR